MQWVFEDLHGAKITYSGDEIPEGESALVIGVYFFGFLPHFFGYFIVDL